MAFNNRPPSPLDPDADPNLPIADSAQAHDIPTGVAPSLAKLQDWIAWLRENGVLYDDPVGTPGLIANDITIDGELTVVEDINAGGSVIIDNFLRFDDPGTSVGADPGANTFHSGNIPKVCGRIVTDGAGGYTIDSDGVNLGLATVGASYIDVDFIRAFSSVNYIPVVTNLSGTGDVPNVDYSNSTASKIRLEMRDSSGTQRNPLTFICRWSLIVMGRQA
jgi:hypothetical protein